MNLPNTPKHLLMAVLSLAALSSASAFGPYFDPYDGTATVGSGKKKGTLAASASASTSDGTDATVIISGSGAKGIKINVQLALEPNGQGSLTFMAKVPADPKIAKKSDKGPRGKKVVVRVKAKGAYTVVDDTATFTFSGNSGKNGGTNITGTFTTNETGNMTFTAVSGFKQKVTGVGRKLDFVFAGISSTVPPPEDE